MTLDKTTTRLLKCLGIALVALPEPTTTAFGAALLLATHRFSQKDDLSVDKFLPGASAYSSYWFERPGDLAEVEANDPETLQRLGQSAPPSLPRQYDGSRRPKAKPSPPTAQTWDEKLGDVVYHRIDMPRLHRRYGLTSRDSQPARLGHIAVP